MMKKQCLMFNVLVTDLPNLAVLEFQVRRICLDSRLPLHLFGKSCLSLAPRQTYKISFWMMNFGSRPPKRTSVIGNTREIIRLQTGRLRRASSTLKTTTKYRNRNGEVKFKGNKCLRSTQPIEFENNQHFGGDVFN